MNNTYEKNQIIGLLYRIFQAENYCWYDSLIPPSFQQIEDVIEESEEIAIRNGNCESGRIKVSYDKETDSFTYYLELGGD